MNYTKKKYDEARRRFIDGQPWDKIVEVFATVPQVTLEEANEMHNRYLSTKNGLHNADRDFLDAVNSVLAKQGPVIAATPAEGMVSLEGVRKACTAMLLDDHGWNVSDAIYAARILCERAVLVPVPTVAEPEPTVTLVDAAEGRSLEVPASAVHEMEYPEASSWLVPETFSQERKLVCSICGACVSDRGMHTAWRGREAVMYDPMKSNYLTSICGLCSAVVVDQTKHTAWHGTQQG
jgi:hypothetical protein